MTGAERYGPAEQAEKDKGLKRPGCPTGILERHRAVQGMGRRCSGERGIAGTKRRSRQQHDVIRGSRYKDF